MSDLVDEGYDAEQTLPEKENGKCKSASTMFLYLRELFFLFALVFTSYTALFNSLPKIGKAPTPVPFFPRNSVVVDYYKGTVSAAFQRASEVDLTIVMYYAPWDADSQSARAPFEEASKFFRDEVFFTAISCWAPGSECKQHVRRIRHFPVIVAYPQHGKGIQYQGPLKSVYIIHFVKTLMRPIERVTSTVDMLHLSSQYNVLVIGAFLFSGSLGGPGYYTFYSTAMKMLEQDPFREIGFAVTTDPEIAAELNFDAVPSIRMDLWNETHEYPLDADYTEESLVKWIWQKKQSVVHWVFPPFRKSHTLSAEVNGPALILFTPRNPLIKTNPMFSMLTDIAYRYHNCNSSKWVKHLSDFIYLKTGYLRFFQEELEKECKNKKKKLELFKSSIESPSVIVPGSFINDSKSAEGDFCDTGILYSMYMGPQSEVCYRKSKSEIPCKGEKLLYQFHGSFFADGDPKSPENLYDAWEDEKCKFAETANEYFKLPYPELLEDELNDSIDGLACSNNRTLSIIAMDSLLYYQFAEGLGINILHIKDKTAVAIIDKKEDSQYIMNSPITQTNLVSFIIKHTAGKLNRFLRSTHDSEFRSVSRHRYPVKPDENCTHTDTEACVPELNSKNFLDFVLNQERAVIVFYHTPYCALCRSISHLFLLLSRYFRHFPALKFARIDGDNNDLPWEYTMDQFPSILFFPTFKKSESRLYSNDLPFTIKNLIHFVLANLEPEAKIPAMMSLCVTFEKLQSEKEARKCKSKIQKQSYDYLSEILKEVRKVMNVWRHLSPTSKFIGEVRKRKQLLIRKLEYFKTNHFLLGSVDKIQQQSTVVTDMLKLYLKHLHFIKSNLNYLNYEGYR